MTGIALKLPNIVDRLVSNQKEIKELYGFARLGASPLALATPIFSTAQSSPASQDAILSDHSTFNGPISLIPKIGIISNGRLDISFVSANTSIAENAFGSNVLVTGTGSPDDLKFIDGAIADGQLLFYQGTNQQIQNILHANLLNGSAVGTGLDTTITVTLSDTGTLVDDDTVNIIGSDNFDVNNVTISNLVTNTSFTYELDAIGSTTSESIVIQDGNILMNDGETLTLDGTLSTTGAPIVIFKFDSTSFGGAWRHIFGGASDTSTNSLKWKEPVIVATTTNGTLASAYENGDTIDGITLVTGDRILLKDQTTGSENGIYTVNASGSPTRATDFDGDDEVVGSVMRVLEGLINGLTTYQMTNTGSVTVGTTALVFAQFGGDTALLISNNTWTGANTFTGLTFSVTSPNIFLGDEVTDTINVSGRIGTDLDPSADNTHSLGSSSLSWLNIFGSVIVGDTVTATTSLSSTGATILGDNVTDTITIGGRFNSDLDPLTDSTYSLGSSSLSWLNIFGSVIVGDTVTATTSLSSTGATILGDNVTDTITIPISDSVSDLGSLSLLWANIFGDNVIVGDGSTTVSRTDQFLYIPTSVGTPTGTPSGFTGRVAMDYDTTNNVLYVFNSAWQSISGGGGTSNSIVSGDSNLIVVDGIGFTWTLDSIVIASLTTELLLGVDLDLNSNDLLNPANITFANSASLTNTSSTALTLNTPSDVDLILSKASTPYFTFDASAGNLTINPSNDLSIETGDDFSVTTTDQLILTAGTTLTLNSLGDFTLQNGGSSIFSYDDSDEEFTFEKDIKLDNGTKIKSNDSTEIGFRVTNSSESIGSQGTNQIPVQTSISSPTAALLDAAFGSAVGDEGVYNTGSAFTVRATKIIASPSTWMLMAVPDGGGNVLGDKIT